MLWPNCGCGKHLTSRLVLHGFALFCTSPNEGGKHLTGTLFLHRPACGNYSVKSISGLLNVSFTSAHHSHVLCGISSHNIDLETGLCFAYSPRIGFLVIVRLSFRLSFGATAKKQKVRVPTYLKKRKNPCCVWLAPHDYRLARNDFHNGGFAESVHTMQNTMQNVHHDSTGWRDFGYRSLRRVS